MNTSALNNPAMNTPVPNAPASSGALLELRDIHLPDPVSWWPPAPGWWILIACIVVLLITIFIAKKIYSGRQLKRDITAELDSIKQQFQKTQDKSQLAKSLSVLLRRASITFYPASNIAGLTGSDWLQHLDATSTSSSGDKKFQSDIGQTLLNAPYLPDNATLEYDAPTLIELCETWLKSPHKKNRQVPLS